jgi:hypothetical protein
LPDHLVDAQSVLTEQNGAILDKIDRDSRNATLHAKVGVLGLLVGTAFTVAALLVVGNRKGRRARDAALAHFESLLDSSSDIIIVTSYGGGITTDPSLYTRWVTRATPSSLAGTHPPRRPAAPHRGDGISRASPNDSVRVEARVMHRTGAG